MIIYVDADACPKAIKQILFKAAIRTKIPLILVANHPLTITRSPMIKTVCVPAGLDVADNYIVEQVAQGDLVITSDIPLADLVIKKGTTVINGKGDNLTASNIKERLSTRNLMDELRGAGMITGGPSTLHPRDIQQFANKLDQILAKHVKR